VIAYDILSYAWIRRGRRRTSTTVMTSRALTTLEDALNPRTDRPVPDIDIRALQHAAWREYRRNGFDWLVSDFVTAGSPLASADWLLGRAEGSSFADLKRDKILPTCPPQTEPARTPRPDTMREQFTFTHAYPDERNPNRSRSVQVPNHAALFALTRWTNLYFPKEWFIKGDPVGGQLNSVFGSWIKDVKLSNPGGGLLGFAHTFYWSRRGSGAHIERLRGALELRYPVKLDDLVLPVPAVVLSELGT
jgi:hypothetical protein